MLHLVVNAFWEALEFELPALVWEQPWRRCLDTYLDAPADICGWVGAQTVQTPFYTVQPRSVAVLISRKGSRNDAATPPYCPESRIVNSQAAVPLES